MPSRTNQKTITIIISSALAVLILIDILSVIPRPPTPTIVIVPHHDVVKSQRTSFWDTLAITPNHIIIIGPDHFGIRQDLITYTDAAFTTYAGIFRNFLPPDFKGATKNTPLIKQDHAITALLAELYARWPTAQIAPFLIGNYVPFSSLSTLTDFLSKTCQRNCLTIASVDFSHYLTEAAADQKDAETLNQLQTMTIHENSLIIPDHADCPACLFTVQEFAKSHNYTWRTYFHDNYGTGTERTTHFIGSYQKSN
jgi:AmmeMemoRadiSam system protein B